MTALLEAKNLTKSFGGIRAAKGVSIEVYEGETVGIIGPNGAGKTTLFNLLTNEIKPDSGSVKLAGENIDLLSIHERVKAGIARTYQVPRPFSEMSVRDNIRVSMMPDDLWKMIRHGGDMHAEQLIAESVGFHSSQLEQMPFELAMGDLRKLELARTLATNPKLLLLDEVFAGLTIGEIEQISELLMRRKNSHETTYMIVSHDLKSLAPLVNRVVVINQGAILTQGTFDDVVSDPHVQEAYLGMEVKH